MGICMNTWNNEQGKLIKEPAIHMLRETKKIKNKNLWVLQIFCKVILKYYSFILKQFKYFGASDVQSNTCLIFKQSM